MINYMNTHYDDIKNSRIYNMHFIATSALAPIYQFLHSKAYVGCTENYE